MPPYRRQLIKDFDAAQKQHKDWPVVVSEGDSWFSYADVTGRLDEVPGQPNGQRAWALLRLESGGAEIMNILSGSQRALLRKTFERWPLDALLFSAGGNDIIGPDLLPLLRPYVDGMTAADLVANGRFERRLGQIQDCYRELLDLLSDAGQTAKVFVNSYDYLVPSDQGVELLGIFKVLGPWLLPSLEAKHVPQALHADVVHLLMDGFVAAVDAVAAEPRGFGRLIRVETRNVVGNNWKDEIHPSRSGAVRVAAKFEQAMRSAGILA
jgi:lysophospholipase L1-like esterase